MAGSLSQADLSQMGVAAQFFQAAIDDCTETRTKLQQVIQTVKWDGPSSITFGKALFDWDVQFTTVVGELNRIRQVLEENKGNYTRNEAQNTETAGRVHRALTPRIF